IRLVSMEVPRVESSRDSNGGGGATLLAGAPSVRRDPSVALGGLRRRRDQILENFALVGFLIRCS
ncbi:MAG: hypothetical protein ACO38P_05310, partial [Phycisphaerales bacterium]